METLNNILLYCGNHLHKNNPSNKFRIDLYNYLMNNHDGSNLLEMGTFHGGTTAIMALVCKQKGGHIYTIDWKNHKIKKAKELINKFNLQNHVSFLEINLYKDNYIYKLADKDINLCFIDAKHEYDAINMDVENCKKIGINTIIFHDYGLNNSNGPNLSVQKIIKFHNLQIIKLIGAEANSSDWITSFGNFDIEGVITKFN